MSAERGRRSERVGRRRRGARDGAEWVRTRDDRLLSEDWVVITLLFSVLLIICAVFAR